MQAYQANTYAPYEAPYQEAKPTRPMTIDDVVTKTGITLAVLSAVATVSFFLVASQHALAAPFVFIGAFGGLAMVLVATFMRKYSPAIVLTYAALEGLVLGAFSFLITFPLTIGSKHVSAGALIFEAIIGTIGVFIGMLIVYKTGAIRVTPKFTRMLSAALIGVLILMIANLVLAMFHVGGGEGLGLRSAGPVGIGFSLLCIGIAAFCFLRDFDAADQMIRAGAPEKAAWAIALGLTVTLVWLYVEILNLLSLLQSD
jgi:uncharacterized YccA/Bax inhibitor family protein